MTQHGLYAATATALCLFAAAPSTAQPIPAPIEEQQPDVVMIAGAPAAILPEEEQAIAEPAPITDDDLDGLRGGQTLVLGNQTLNAITSGNTLQGDYVAGDISISDNALTAFTGMGNFAINTGAQVSLQSGMNVVINVGR